MSQSNMLSVSLPFHHLLSLSLSLNLEPLLQNKNTICFWVMGLYIKKMCAARTRYTYTHIMGTKEA